MAYFDSPKNRALWEVELSKLREEKELRSTGKSSKTGSADKNASADLKKSADRPTRVRTSYKELVEEARQEHLAKNGGREPKSFVYANERNLQKDDLAKTPKIPGKVK